MSRTDVGFVSSAPTGSVIWVEGSGDEFVSWDATQPCPEGCYDLPRGTLAALGSNTLWGPGATAVRVADEYVVIGPPGGPLAFEVVLQLDATIEIEGTAFAEAGIVGATSRTIERTTTGITQTALPIVVAPGTPFQLYAHTYAVGGRLGGSGVAIATIRFRSLPREYVVTSCQGFDRETPTCAATWGGVKAHYR